MELLSRVTGGVKLLVFYGTYCRMSIGRCSYLGPRRLFDVEEKKNNMKKISMLLTVERNDYVGNMMQMSCSNLLKAL